MRTSSARSRAAGLVAGIAVVTASVATVGVAFAPAASAAASAISATATQSSYPVGGSAVINVTTTGTPTNLEWSVISGPDATGTSGYPNGHDCAPATSSPSVCTVPNTHGEGTDVIGIFDGTSSNSSYASGEIYTTVSVVFSVAQGPPVTVSLTPTSASVPTGGCANFAVQALDAAGNPATNAKITIQVTQSQGLLSSGSPLATCGSAPVTQLSNSGGGLLGGTATLRFTVTTGTTTNPGAAAFGVKSSSKGTASVIAYSNGAKDAAPATTDPKSDASTLTVGTASTAVNLSVSPTLTTQSLGTGVTYTVLATNASGAALPGLAIGYVISGPDAVSASPAAPQCGAATTNANGVTGCTLSNHGTAGTDQITFFVNSQNGGTTGPDASEPQTDATAIYRANVASRVVLDVSGKCDTTSPSSTNTATTNRPGSTVIEVCAKVQNSGVPVTGAPVAFSVNNGFVSASKTFSATNGKSVTTNTDANGVATAFVSASAAGTQAVLASNGGASASGSVTYSGSGQAELLLFPEKHAVAGQEESVEAVALNADGSPAGNVSVIFSVTGANPTTAAVKKTTASNGAAVFSYQTSKAGTDTISAFEDLNGNSAKDANEPSATTTAAISSSTPPPSHHKRAQHPKLTATSHSISAKRGQIVLHVTTHPKVSNAVVTFYRIKHGHRHALGKVPTGRAGKARGKLTAPIGSHLKFQVRVGARGNVKKGFSNKVRVHVR